MSHPTARRQKSIKCGTMLTYGGGLIGFVVYYLVDHWTSFKRIGYEGIAFEGHVVGHDTQFAMLVFYGLMKYAPLTIGISIFTFMTINLIYKHYTQQNL